jgi:hypothetical protein
LARTTGLEARPLPDATTADDPFGPAGEIELRTLDRDYRFAVEIKANVDRRATLNVLREQRARHDRRNWLLVTPYLAPTLADACRQTDLDLPFIDTAGNAYLRAPGLHVFVKGEKRPAPARASGHRLGGTAAALRVTFAMLCRPELLNAPYRTIADAAGVALGTVGWVLLDLQARGHLLAGKANGARQLLEPRRLVDEWVTNYPIKLRPKLNARRFRAPDPNWWKTAALPTGAYWGGEPAADRLTGNLKPGTVTVYLAPERARANLDALVAAHRLRADPGGEIEVLDAVWHFYAAPADPALAPPLLVYADLVATMDARALETARIVREQHVDGHPGQT